MTSVFWTSTQHADRGIDARELFDSQDGVEESAAGSAVSLRHFDTHDSELEELVDERPWDSRLFVHLADEGADVCLGEIPDAVAKDALVFSEDRQRLDVVEGFWRHERILLRALRRGQRPMLSLAQNVHSATTEEARRGQPLACVALIAYAYPRPARGLSADGASRLGALRASSPATGATGATATSLQEPPRRRRRRQQPERSQQGPDPHRHQLRPRRCHRDRQARAIRSWT